MEQEIIDDCSFFYADVQPISDPLKPPSPTPLRLRSLCLPSAKNTWKQIILSTYTPQLVWVRGVGLGPWLNSREGYDSRRKEGDDDGEDVLKLG